MIGLFSHACTYDNGMDYLDLFTTYMLYINDVLTNDNDLVLMTTFKDIMINKQCHMSSDMRSLLTCENNSSNVSGVLFDTSLSHARENTFDIHSYGNHICSQPDSELYKSSIKSKKLSHDDTMTNTNNHVFLSTRNVDFLDSQHNTLKKQWYDHFEKINNYLKNRLIQNLMLNCYLRTMDAQEEFASFYKYFIPTSSLDDYKYLPSQLLMIRHFVNPILNINQKTTRQIKKIYEQRHLDQHKHITKMMQCWKTIYDPENTQDCQYGMRITTHTASRASSSHTNHLSIQNAWTNYSPNKLLKQTKMIRDAKKLNVHANSRDSTSYHQVHSQSRNTRKPHHGSKKYYFKTNFDMPWYGELVHQTTDDLPPALAYLAPSQSSIDTKQTNKKTKTFDVQSNHSWLHTLD